MIEPKVWYVAGSMQHPLEPNRMIDGFDVYIQLGEKKYIISSKDLEQFKIK